ncbi:MAG: D-Ala-D-Ala carboxypeptidase family metallohydrolase [Pseudomonadota bacterium]
MPELACRCAGRFCRGAYWHDPVFLDRLQALREAVGEPLILTSAHRCPQWNAAVGGAPFSQHKRIAVDVLLQGHDRRALFGLAQQAGFTGFGLARNFLHLDRRGQSAIWYYQGSEAEWQT